MTDSHVTENTSKVWWTSKGIEHTIYSTHLFYGKGILKIHQTILNSLNQIEPRKCSTHIITSLHKNGDVCVCERGYRNRYLINYSGKSDCWRTPSNLYVRTSEHHIIHCAPEHGRGESDCDWIMNCPHDYAPRRNGFTDIYIFWKLHSHHVLVVNYCDILHF